MSSNCSVTNEGGESAREEPLPGFRFFPTPEVLVSFYLKKKIQGQDSQFKHFIPVIDVCKIEPWDIPAFLGEPDFSDPEKVWYFFTVPVYKYNNSPRRSRITERGFYKMQGKEHNVKARQSKEVVGTKKNFTFYRGRPRNAMKDDWFLDEYSLTGDEKSNFFLCCLKKGPATSKKLKEVSMCDPLSDSSSGEAGGGHIAYNYEDYQAAAATDMNLESVQHLVPKEQGDVLNGKGNHHECYDSPYSSCLSNDVLTIDDDDLIFSGLDSQVAFDKKFEEYSALIKGDMDRERLQPSDPPQPYSPPQPYKPPHPPQQPQPEDYSSSKLSSPHTEQANVRSVDYGDGSKVQSSFGENNSHLTVTNSFSTSYQNVPISNVVHNFQNGASDERIPEEDMSKASEPGELGSYQKMSTFEHQLKLYPSPPSPDEISQQTYRNSSDQLSSDSLFSKAKFTPYINQHHPSISSLIGGAPRRTRLQSCIIRQGH